MRHRTAVITDSASGLSIDLLQRHDIRVVPMTFRIGDTTFAETPDLDYGATYDQVLADPRLPFIVSAPLPEAWRDTFVDAASAPDVAGVLAVTLSARFSAAYDAAKVGAELAQALLPPDVAVAVVDSDAMAGAQGLVCVAAAEAARNGADLETVARRAAEASRNVKAVAMFGALDQIHRVGNVSRPLLWVAQTVGVKPIARFDATGWKIVSRPLTRPLGLRQLRSVVHDATPDVRATRAVVMHVQAERDAQRTADALTQRPHLAEVSVCQMHPFAGVPAGRGSVGVAWMPSI